MPTNPVKVLYIAGLGRSGSTLLTRLLGEVDGFFNVGEAAGYLLLPETMHADIPCGCGEAVGDCPFWQDVLPDDAARSAVRADLARLHRLPWLLSPIKPKGIEDEFARVQSLLAHFYGTLAERTGGRIIIDSSKRPAIAFLLSRIENIELHVVHLVRDPRGIVASRSKEKAYLKRFSATQSVRYWWMRNAMADRLAGHADGYQRIRYEDFAHDPAAVLTDIVRSVDGRTPDLGFLDGRTGYVQRQHILAGNPDKLAGGPVEIRESRWQLPWLLRTTVSVLTFPFLRRYRYDFAPPTGEKTDPALPPIST